MRTGEKLVLCRSKFWIWSSSDPSQDREPFEFVATFILGNFVSVKKYGRETLGIGGEFVSVLVQGACREECQARLSVPVELDQTILFVEHLDNNSSDSGDDLNFNLTDRHQIRRDVLEKRKDSYFKSVIWYK